MLRAYEIMHGWDAEAGIPPRTNRDLDIEIPGCVGRAYEDWLAALANDDVGAILEGRAIWGLRPLA